jgi:hypothetical protein
MNDIQVKTVELDGKKISYTNETEFLVQIGKNKSSYKTKWRFVGNLHQAVLWYRGINVGKGYKKRLLMPSCAKNPVLAKYLS